MSEERRDERREEALTLELLKAHNLLLELFRQQQVQIRSLEVRMADFPAQLQTLKDELSAGAAALAADRATVVKMQAEADAAQAAATSASARADAADKANAAQDAAALLVDTKAQLALDNLDKLVQTLIDANLIPPAVVPPGAAPTQPV